MKSTGILKSKLIPAISAGKFIGVRTPDFRKYARQFAKRKEGPVK